LVLYVLDAYFQAQNVPPSVAIASPANHATFVSAATVTIQATASDRDGMVAKV